MENGYGAWTLLPPLVAIVLCVITRRVLVSLFLGILAGGLVLNGGNVFAGLVYSLEQMVTSIADPTNTRLLLFNLMMGAGIAFIWRLGGSRALTEWARRKIRSRRAAGGVRGCPHPPLRDRGGGAGVMDPVPESRPSVPRYTGAGGSGKGRRRRRLRRACRGT